MTARARWTQSLPYHLAATAAGLAGAFVLHLPLAAIFASMLVTGWLYFPVRQALGFLSADAPALAADVQRMHATLDSAAAAAQRERRRDARRRDAAALPGGTVTAHGVRDPRIAVTVNGVVARPGDFVTLTGPSGSGKTTLLRALAGLTPLASGNVSIAGVDVRDVARHDLPAGQRILLSDVVYYQPQEPPIDLRATVFDNVTMGSRRTGPVTSAEENLVRLRLCQLGLGAYATRLHTPLAYASGGERRRLALARTIFRNPAFVLLDEPTAGLDNASAALVVREIRSLQRAGAIVVAASHDARLIAASTRSVSLAPLAAPGVA